MCARRGPEAPLKSRAEVIGGGEYCSVMSRSRRARRTERSGIANKPRGARADTETLRRREAACAAFDAMNGDSPAIPEGSLGDVCSSMASLSVLICPSGRAVEAQGVQSMCSLATVVTLGKVKLGRASHRGRT